LTIASSTPYIVVLSAIANASDRIATVAKAGRRANDRTAKRMWERDSLKASAVEDRKRWRAALRVTPFAAST